MSSPELPRVSTRQPKVARRRSKLPAAEPPSPEEEAAAVEAEQSSRQPKLAKRRSKLPVAGAFAAEESEYLDKPPEAETAELLETANLSETTTKITEADPSPGGISQEDGGQLELGAVSGELEVAATEPEAATEAAGQVPEAKLLPSLMGEPPSTAERGGQSVEGTTGQPVRSERESKLPGTEASSTTAEEAQDQSHELSQSNTGQPKRTGDSEFIVPEASSLTKEATGKQSPELSARQPKLANRRRKLPAAVGVGAATVQQKEPRLEKQETKELAVEQKLRRLSSQVLIQLQSTELELDKKFMPGKVQDLTTAELSKAGSKKSRITLRSGKKLDISLVEGSFRRITGIREQMDDSGSAIIRRVEIEREPGKSLGFYISQGDGWMRKDGIFVSRVNLGSSVEVNGLLNVGDEIMKVNSVDVTKMMLDEVALVMKYVKKMVLTVRVLTSFGFTNHLSLHRSLISRKLPRTPSLDEKPPPSKEKTRPSSRLARNKRLSSYLKKSEEDMLWEVKRARFQMKSDTLTNSMLKSTSFGASFMSNLNSSPAVGDSTSSGDGAQINPYEEVSFNSKPKLPTSDSSEISPYARVSVRTDAEGGGVVVEVHPQGGQPKAEGPGASADASNKALGSSLNKTRELGTSCEEIEMSILADSTINPYASLSRAGDKRKEEEDSSIDPYSSVGFKTEMKMDSLLELLRTKPLHSSSPAVKRRSAVLGEEEEKEEDREQFPDHIYAKIDCTRKQSHSNLGAVVIDGEDPPSAAPPPLPTSPLPQDRGVDGIDSMTIPLIPSEQDEESQNGPRGEEPGGSMGLRGDHVTSRDLVPGSAGGGDDDQEPNYISDDDVANLVSVDDCDLHLEELLGPETPPPPLPPPYVPDEGPPDSTDEEEEEEEGEEEGESQEEGSTPRRHRLVRRKKPVIDTNLPVITISMHDDTPTLSAPMAQGATEVELSVMDENVTSDAASVEMGEVKGEKETPGGGVEEGRVDTEEARREERQESPPNSATPSPPRQEPNDPMSHGSPPPLSSPPTGQDIKPTTSPLVRQRHFDLVSQDSASLLPPPPPPPAEEDDGASDSPPLGEGRHVPVPQDSSSLPPLPLVNDAEERPPSTIATPPISEKERHLVLVSQDSASLLPPPPPPPPLAEAEKDDGASNSPLGEGHLVSVPQDSSSLPLLPPVDDAEERPPSAIATPPISEREKHLVLVSQDSASLLPPPPPPPPEDEEDTSNTPPHSPVSVDLPSLPPLPQLSGEEAAEPCHAPRHLNLVTQDSASLLPPPPPPPAEDNEETSNSPTLSQSRLNPEDSFSSSTSSLSPSDDESDEDLQVSNTPKRPSSSPLLDMSRDSTSSLPPPPPPPGEPPALDDSDNEDEDNLENPQEEKGMLFSPLPTTSKESQLDGLKGVSGVLLLRVHALDISSRESRTFWSDFDVQKVTFVTAVDDKLKVTANNVKTVTEGIPADDIWDEDDQYKILLFKHSKITFSVNPICLPSVSRHTSLADIFPDGLPTKQDVYIDFEQYGHLKLSLDYNLMSSAIYRLEADVYTKPSFTDLVNLNPRKTGSPLILEQCIEIIEQYGLKSPNLYERCTLTSHKHRALAASMDNLRSQSIKNVLTKCSIHAYTGLLVDFFCELPEPFFTNDISSSLTQAVSVGGDLRVLEGFLQCLPEDVSMTLELLLRHFKRLLSHGARNGVTKKSLCELFGPLLLIPSLSPDLNTSTTALEFAEEFESQAKVMELLLSIKNTSPL